jgi:hypothetical protein
LAASECASAGCAEFSAWQNGDVARLSDYLDQHETPSHILFNNGLWLAVLTEDEYREKIRDQLELLAQKAPASQILVRGSASSVQAIVSDLVAPAASLTNLDSTAGIGSVVNAIPSKRKIACSRNSSTSTERG